MSEALLEMAGEAPGADEHEVVELRHRALDRAAFVSGVVPAVRFVSRSSPGFFSMLDVMSSSCPIAAASVSTPWRRMHGRSAAS